MHFNHAGREGDGSCCRGSGKVLSGDFLMKHGLAIQLFKPAQSAVFELLQAGLATAF